MEDKEVLKVIRVYALGLAALAFVIGGLDKTVVWGMRFLIGFYLFVEILVFFNKMKRNNY